MGRRKKNEPDGCLLAIALAFGIPMLFAMAHPILFWLVVVPLTPAVIILIIAYIKGKLK